MSRYVTVIFTGLFEVILTFFKIVLGSS